jgi:hypothetical protein
MRYSASPKAPATARKAPASMVSCSWSTAAPPSSARCARRHHTAAGKAITTPVSAP